MAYSRRSAATVSRKSRTLKGERHHTVWPCNGPVLALCRAFPLIRSIARLFILLFFLFLRLSSQPLQ